MELGSAAAAETARLSWAAAAAAVLPFQAGLVLSQAAAVALLVFASAMEAPGILGFLLVLLIPVAAYVFEVSLHHHILLMAQKVVASAAAAAARCHLHCTLTSSHYYCCYLLCQSWAGLLVQLEMDQSVGFC